MRTARHILASLVAITAMMLSTFVGAPAANASGSPLQYHTWRVVRNTDASGVVHVAPQELASFTVNATLKASFLSTLSAGDIVQLKVVFQQGLLDRFSPQASILTNVPAVGSTTSREPMSFKVPSTATLTSVYYTINGFAKATTDGTLQFAPRVYVNGIESNLASSDLFSTMTRTATHAPKTDSYTATAEDYILQTTTTGCADLSAVTAGQALTVTMAPTANGNANAASPITNIYFGDGKSLATSVPTPKPAAFLAAVNTVQFSGVTTGTVYTASMQIKAAGNDVTGNCFTSYGTMLPTGLNLAVSGFDAISDMMTNKNATINCKLTDRVTGTVLSMVPGTFSYASATQSCGPVGVIVGRTYDVDLELTPGQAAGAAIARWSYVWTVGSPLFATPPVLSGGSATSAVYEATNVDTPSFIGGSAHTALGNDGLAGKLVVDRLDGSTLRISHWGPTSSLPIGGSDHVDFTAPITDSSFQFTDNVWRGNGAQVSWYGNHDKWLYSVEASTGWKFVSGSMSASSTQTSTLALSALDDVCVSALGAGATYEYDRTEVPFAVQSAATSNPLVRVICRPTSNLETINWAEYPVVLASVNVSGATATATYLTRLDSVGETDPIHPTVSGEANPFTCAGIKVATNPRSNLSGTDPVLVITAAHGSNYDITPCRDLFFGDDGLALDRLSVTIIRADGSVSKKVDAQPAGAPFTANYIGGSIAFDSTGAVNYLLTSTTTTRNALRNLDLFSVALSGGNAGALTFTKHLTQDVVSAYDSNGFQDSFFFLANGAGDSEKIYAARIAQGMVGNVFGQSVINLSSGAITTGEALSARNSGMWVAMAIYYTMQNGVEAEPAGGVNYYVQPAQGKYSVIHWVPGIDPSLGPTITSANSATVTAGTTAVLTASASTTGNAWAISGGANSSLFQINSSTGVLEFKAAATPGTYTVEIQVTSGGRTATQTVTVTVPDTVAPVVTVNQSPSVANGSTAVVTPSANEHVTWSITGGANQNDFNIDATSGVVTFKTAMPSGTYIVEITATDDNGNVTHKTITVTVGSDTTPPTVTVNQSPQVSNGATSVLTPSANENVTWSITGGANRSLFQINSSTGALEFKNPATPGTYAVEITATDDAGNVTHKTITVTVPAGPSAPTITVPTPLTVAEFSRFSIYTLTASEDVTWEVVSTTGLSNVYINSDGNLAVGDVRGYTANNTIVLRATSTSTGLSATKTITVNVVPLVLTATGTLDTNGQGSYTIGATTAANAANVGLLINPTTTNSNITNLVYTNGVLTFTADPNFTGDVDVQFCINNDEGCVDFVNVTLHVGSVTAPSSASFKVASPKSTRISWSGSFNAASYVVKLGKKTICRTTATSCLYNGLIGAGRKVTVIAYGSNGSVASVRATSNLASLGKIASIINFDINSAKLTWRQKYRLNVLVKTLKAGGFTTLRIVGHTDNIGSKTVDPYLSLNRAKAVKAYLLYFMPKLKITVSGVGRTKPAKANTNPENKAFNRRAEVYAG
jgi:hypothetical protein